MNEYSIKIQIPEGFKPDGGEQPRRPKEGEWFLGDGIAKECYVDFEYSKHIILKNKKPKYKVRLVEEELDNIEKYIEIKALEDALDIIKLMCMHPNDDPSELGRGEIYEALKELIK